MTNERLRSAIAAADLSYTTFSEHLGVDRKTVERWITTDRLPHRSHRMDAAKVLEKTEGYLWPSTDIDPRTTSASRAELVDFYPNRGSVPTDLWTTLVGEATEAIDLLAYAASFFHDSVPGFADLLQERARSGTSIRLLFGDPAAEAVSLRGEEEDIGALMSARCELTWRYLNPVAAKQGIHARQHRTTLYASIFRFDDALLVNPHAYGAPAGQSPVLHLARIPGGRLYNHYMESFDRVWATGAPVDSSAR